MTDEEILSIFSRNGMRIEPGAQFSAKGQIVQLLNGYKELAEYIKRNASQPAVEAEAKYRCFFCGTKTQATEKGQTCPECGGRPA